MSEQPFRATVRGVDDVLVFATDDLGDYNHVSEKKIDGCRWHTEKHITNLRPVRVVEEGQIVLSADADLLADLLLRCVDDPSDPIHDRRKLSRGASVVNAAIKEENTAVIDLIEQIKAQTKPPRMAEPKGFGAIVEANWLHAHKGRQRYLSDGVGWISESALLTHTWDDLIDPVLIRDGI